MHVQNFFNGLLAVAATSLGLAAAAPAAVITGQGTWELTLQGRDINLNAVAAESSAAVYLYDSTLNVTWLRDARFGGVRMNWTTASDWANNLVTGAGTSAITDWRLPTTVTSSNLANSFDGSTSAGFNVASSSSEMASLFFSTLGNVSSMADANNAREANVYGLQNSGSFLNFQSDLYWSGTQISPGNAVRYAWFFQMAYGAQDLAIYQPVSTLAGEPMAYALAVRSGDVLPVSTSIGSTVAEPQSLALALVALVALAGLGLGRRRRAG